MVLGPVIALGGGGGGGNGAPVGAPYVVTSADPDLTNEKLFSSLVQEGDTADIPAAGNAGALFYDRQEGILYRDNGVSWDRILVTSSGPGVRAAQFLSPITWNPANLTLALLANVAIYVPIMIYTRTVFDKIWFRVTTAAGAGNLARLGMYEDSLNTPGALIVDAGTAAIDAIAAVSKAFASVRTERPRRVWVCLIPQANVTIRCGAGNSNFHWVLGTNTNNPTGAASVDGYMTAAQAYGPLPDPATVGPYSSGNVPWIALGVNPS